jgi:Mg-chelatase subunit ChlI
LLALDHARLAIAMRRRRRPWDAEHSEKRVVEKCRPQIAQGNETGEDKAYDTANHVANLRAGNVTPHVTQNNSATKTGKSRQSAVDGRTTRHQGYGMSQSRRAMIECIFGWGKQHGTMRKTKHRGIRHVAADFMKPRCRLP